MLKKNSNLNLNLWMVSLLDVQLDFLVALPINFLPHDERDVRHSGPVIQARSIQAQGLNVV
jgi:hypothetical protein